MSRPRKTKFRKTKLFNFTQTLVLDGFDDGDLAISQVDRSMYGVSDFHETQNTKVLFHCKALLHQALRPNLNLIDTKPSSFLKMSRKSVQEFYVFLRFKDESQSEKKNFVPT